MEAAGKIADTRSEREFSTSTSHVSATTDLTCIDPFLTRRNLRTFPKKTRERIVLGNLCPICNTKRKTKAKFPSKKRRKKIVRKSETSNIDVLQK